MAEAKVKKSKYIFLLVRIAVVAGGGSFGDNLGLQGAEME